MGPTCFHTPFALRVRGGYASPGVRRSTHLFIILLSLESWLSHFLYEMEITSTTAFLSSLVTIAIAWMLMRIVNWVWLKPKKLEKWLRQQGFSGNSYRLFHGDMKEMLAMRKQATISKPINPSDSYVHNIVPRILPFQHHINTIYGTPLPPTILFIITSFYLFITSYN